MVTPINWFEVRLLDEIDIARDAVQEAARLRAVLPTLEARLDQARRQVEVALAPLPPEHPADDTWDDSVYFNSAMLQSGYQLKAADVERARQELAELAGSPDPGRKIAGLLLTAVHAHLKTLGLHTNNARVASTPRSIGGQSLAEVIWQARNQDQHYNDQETLHAPVVTSFRLIIAHSPSTFGLATPLEDSLLERTLKQRSWAPEVLRLLGWVDSATAAAGIASVRP